MYRYRNILTGYEFETTSQVSAPNYVQVGADPAPKVVRQDPIPEAKEPKDEDKKVAKKAVTKKKPVTKRSKKA